MQQKLAAILAVDVVDATGPDRAAADELRTIQYELIDPTISRYGGRIFAMLPATTLVEFAEPGHAVGCGLEIQRGVVLGKRVKVEAFAFIPSGVTVEDGVFIGPHGCFTNDRQPAAVDANGELLGADDWTITPTVVEAGASIGANATIVCGVRIGAGALVGAGSVVTKDVPPHTLVVGNPARPVGPWPPKPNA